MPESVVVAMSGGVDSSVAAALLVEQGYEVTGVMMRLWAEQENLCCSAAAEEDARRVAGQLGIDFQVADYAAEFRNCVVDHFIDEYSRGRTPNPCLECNRHLRFGLLLQHARATGASYLATGHYARIDFVNGQYRLRMATDPSKDQSYVLYMLGQVELARVRFPVGSYAKPDIRQMAQHRGLVVADKDESMDLCFVSNGDYRRFLQVHAPESIRPGPIVDIAGRVIGQHQGLPFYTIGQRRGLGIAAKAALYVLGLDTEENTLVVGPIEALGRSRLHATRVSYVSGRPPDEPVRVRAKIRYKAKLSAAVWHPLGADQARVEFRSPLRDITPGQAVVAYLGDQVLGGGTIT